MKEIREQIIGLIINWRAEALEILPTAEFRFFWPSFNLLKEIIIQLELNRIILVLGVRVLRGLIITMHNRQWYYIPGIVAAVINHCADYLGIGIPRKSLSEFMGISVKNIRKEGAKIEDIIEMDRQKMRLI
jgi:hypothetical protein